MIAIIKKISYYDKPFPGIYFLLNNERLFCPYDTPAKIYRDLDIAVEKTTLAGSDLLGIYGAILDDLIVVPDIVDEKLDMDMLKMPHNWNAWGNLLFYQSGKILLSRRVASARDVLEDLGYKVKITEISTPGSLILGNNRGLLISYRIEDHAEEISSFFDLPVMVGSLNSGFGYLGIAAVANDNLALVGETSTGFEIARLSEALEL